LTILNINAQNVLAMHQDEVDHVGSSTKYF